MARRKRTQGELQHDRLLVARLDAIGLTVDEIVDQLNEDRRQRNLEQVSRSQVSYDIKLARKVIAQLAEAEIRLEKGRRIAQTDHIIREAMRAWEVSRQDGVTTTTTLKKGQETIKTTARPNRSGDPRLLVSALKGIELVSQILGFGDQQVEVDRPPQLKGEVPVSIDEAQALLETQLGTRHDDGRIWLWKGRARKKV